MNKLLLRFEECSKEHLLVIDELDKYLGKIHIDLVDLIWAYDDDTIEENNHIFYWCHKDLLEQYLEK